MEPSGAKGAKPPRRRKKRRRTQPFGAFATRRKTWYEMAHKDTTWIHRRTGSETDNLLTVMPYEGTHGRAPTVFALGIWQKTLVRFRAY